MISARFPSFLLFLLINHSWNKTRSSYDIILLAKNSKNFFYLQMSNSSKPCIDRKEEGYCEIVIQPVLFDCQTAWWNGDSQSNFPTLMTHSNDVKKKLRLSSTWHTSEPRLEDNYNNGSWNKCINYYNFFSNGNMERTVPEWFISQNN